jgi:uncharacterized membrane protein YeaQ/YmgE (transglycosylase-associated protein family)
VSFVAWVVTGFVAGVLARAAVGTPRRGCLFTTLVGIAGGLLGGIIFNAAGDRGIDDFGLWSILVAFVGAALLLLVLQAFDRR